MINQTLLCSQCGNSSLVKSGTNSFKCSYCGAITIIETENKTEIDDPNLDSTLVKMATEKGLIVAVAHYKKQSDRGLKESKEYVENLCKLHGVTPKKGACFIATACYGSYDAPEVIVLRRFRDEVLMHSFGGRLFIKAYYFLSPPIASFISRHEKLRQIVREFIIEPISRKI
ncbi:MAG: CFI-box-CTERM domain-containing protein [Bacteroidota bacterium]